MKIAYTVCTLNRLGQAVVLAKSILAHNPSFTFFIGLADELSDRIQQTDYPFLNFIPLSGLSLDNLKELLSRYDIFELCCALKPYFGEYLLTTYDPTILVYLDTDICVYNNFSYLEESLIQNSILVTPHFLTPPPRDGKFPLERDVLNSGLYNGGFFAIKKNSESLKFLSWWKDRVTTEGYNRVCEGMMVDQLWLNLTPLYFRNVKIVDHPGCNLAYWNMHERIIEQFDEKYFVNSMPLIFFHFSGFKLDIPDQLSIHQNRFTEGFNKALTRIIAQYAADLKENAYEIHLRIPCFYNSLTNVKSLPLIKVVLIRILKHVGYKLEKIRKV